MKCPCCREENPPGKVRCSSCGKPLRQGDIPSKDYIHDYLTESILVTLFCCQPFGIVPLVYAAQVKSFLSGGFREEALEASEKAGN